ncbi:hypothetical protein BKA93DRAFT_110745 [Sparassis latifolia]
MTVVDRYQFIRDCRGYYESNSNKDEEKFSFNIASLPHEVTDRIIDFLWDDQRTLYSCALTCHAWLPRSRFVMYHNIRIREGHSFDAFVRVLQLPHLQHLFSNTLFLEVKWWARYETTHSWTHLFPLAFGRRFSNVTDLKIRGMNWINNSPSLNIFTLGFSQLTRVVTLDLDQCMFHTFRELQRLLCAFPNIRNLHVINLRLESDLPPNSSQEFYVRGPSPITLHLTSLITTLGACSSLHQWLCNTPSVESLSMLSIGGSNKDFEFAAADGLLRAVGGVLRDLYLNLWNSLQYEPFTQRHSLSACSNLKFLALSFYYFSNNVGTHLYRLLGTISSDTRLTRLRFTFHLPLETDTAYLANMQGIEEILAQEHFHDLAIVDIHVEYFKGCPDLTRMNQEIKKLLSGLFPPSVQLNFQATITKSL